MVAPDKIAELIRLLSETQHALGEVIGEVDDTESYQAGIYKRSLEANKGQLALVFENVHRLARPLSELRSVE